MLNPDNFSTTRRRAK